MAGGGRPPSPAGAPPREFSRPRRDFLGRGEPAPCSTAHAPEAKPTPAPAPSRPAPGQPPTGRAPDVLRNIRRAWETQHGIYRVGNRPPSADGTSANGTSGTGSFRSIPRSTLVHCFKPRTAIPCSPAIPHPFRGGTKRGRQPRSIALNARLRRRHARRQGAPRRHPGARRGRSRWPAGASLPAQPGEIPRRKMISFRAARNSLTF